MKLEISGIHTEVSDKLNKYITKKIGGLEKYVPRAARASAHSEVRIKETKIKQREQFTCEVTLKLASETIVISETTSNTFAAVDVAETKLKLALKKYKDKHANPKLHQRLASRFKRR